MGIYKGRDLKLLSLQDMVKHFGKAGNYFYHAVRGIDDRGVISHRDRKSIGAERTFETDLTNMDEVMDKLVAITDIMWDRCESKQKTGRTLTLKLRYADFTTITRSHTSLEDYTREEVQDVLAGLLPVEDIQKQGIRLLGVTMSNFREEKRHIGEQLEIGFF